MSDHPPHLSLKKSTENTFATQFLQLLLHTNFRDENSLGRDFSLLKSSFLAQGRAPSFETFLDSFSYSNKRLHPLGFKVHSLIDQTTGIRHFALVSTVQSSDLASFPGFDTKALFSRLAFGKKEVDQVRRLLGAFLENEFLISAEEEEGEELPCSAALRDKLVARGYISKTPSEKHFYMTCRMVMECESALRAMSLNKKKEEGSEFGVGKCFFCHDNTYYYYYQCAKCACLIHVHCYGELVKGVDEEKDVKCGNGHEMAKELHGNWTEFV